MSLNENLTPFEERSTPEPPTTSGLSDPPQNVSAEALSTSDVARVTASAVPSNYSGTSAPQTSNLTESPKVSKFDPSTIEVNKTIRWLELRANGNAVPGNDVTSSPRQVLADVDRVLNGEKRDLETLVFRDPDNFKAGEIRNHLPMWREILRNNPKRDQILKWIEHGVSVNEFMQPYNFKGKMYPCPPKHKTRNSKSCKNYEENDITKMLTERIKSGAFRIWGKVGKCRPPKVVLPLTVEPTKPRLCIDARFLNLWMRDTPCRLDNLATVPQFVYPGSYVSKIDDKSAYDHVFLTEASQKYFGIEWKGWWLVSTTLPAGWKNAQFVYQSIGGSVSTFLRERGIACSLYIDDRLIGEMFSEKGHWSGSIEQRECKLSQESAVAALYVTCKVVVSLGYFLGLKKCKLEPTKKITFLGMNIDTQSQAFLIPEDKRQKFKNLREEILQHENSTSLQSLKKFKGKCIYFSLAFPGAKYHTRQMTASVENADRTGSNVILSKDLRQEIEFWRFLDSWDSPIPWRKEQSVQLSISADANSLTEDLREENIDVKELYAVLEAIKSLPDSVNGCTLEANVENQVTLKTWRNCSTKSLKVIELTSQLIHEVTKRNLNLEINHTPSYSRRPSKLDAMLSPRCWKIVQDAFGGPEGHNLDLMSLDSNVQRDRNGVHLRHFTPYPTEFSSGVNVFAQDLKTCDGERTNAYVYPPFFLISRLLRLIRSSGATVTMVVPKLSPLPVWWPIINAMAKGKKKLAKRGSDDAVLFPTKKGYQPQKLQTELWIFRVGPN